MWLRMPTSKESQRGSNERHRFDLSSFPCRPLHSLEGHWIAHERHPHDFLSRFTWYIYAEAVVGTSPFSQTCHSIFLHILYISKTDGRLKAMKTIEPVVGNLVKRSIPPSCTSCCKLLSSSGFASGHERWQRQKTKGHQLIHTRACYLGSHTSK